VKVSYLADNDLQRSLVVGVRRRKPSIDFRSAQEASLDGLDDQVAAEQHRVLVSHDVSTMPVEFARFRIQQTSPGVLLVPQRFPIHTAIEALVLIWELSTADEWQNRICYIPTLADFI
jgi:hypothetical protein